MSIKLYHDNGTIIQNGDKYKIYDRYRNFIKETSSLEEAERILNNHGPSDLILLLMLILLIAIIIAIIT